MKKMKSADSGYALVLLVIITLVMLTIGGVILTIAAMNFKMKTINSQAEKAFYLAEAGAEEAYTISKDYLRLAIEYSKNEVEEFEAKINQNSYEDINEVFRSSFENYIKGDVDSITCLGLANKLNDYSSYLIYEDGYPIVTAVIEEEPNCFLIEISSTYKYEQVEMNSNLELKISIPDYDTQNNMSSLIEIINWGIEG